jgi:hypothetical protein
MGDLENQLLRFPSGAHDDLCLVGETLIKTDKGDVRLEDIQLGDKVITRNGLKEVVGKRYTGIKEVITRCGLTGTPNHPIITKSGIKDLTNLDISDILHIWNEKLSCIEERSITDILIQKDINLDVITGDTINGKHHHFHFIDKCGLIILERYQKVMSFITKMVTHLTMNFQILGAYQTQLTPQTTLMNLKELPKQGRILELPDWKQVNGTSQKQVENGTPKWQKEFGKKRKVYNLVVEDNHEYLANNILVHNCDALQMLTTILEFPKGIKKAVSGDNLFDRIRQIAIDAKKPKDKHYIFGGKRMGFRGIPYKVDYK